MKQITQFLLEGESPTLIFVPYFFSFPLSDSGRVLSKCQGVNLLNFYARISHGYKKLFHLVSSAISVS